MAEKALTIKAPRQGIAPSPHVGFANMQNLDIFDKPGVTRLNNILEKKSATTVDALVKWIVKNPASPANIYALDSNGVVYNSSNSGVTWAELKNDLGGTGQGLAVWKDYLFVAEATVLNSYGPLSGSPSWAEFQTDLTSSDWHPMLVSKVNGKLYIGSGRYVASLEEVDGQDFDDGNGATFTWSGGDSSTSALALPEDYQIKSLAEQGRNLMIGTWVGTNIYDNKIADIFPWGYIEGQSWDRPIQMTENGVNAMINVGSYLYILAGIDGRVYKCNGTQSWVIGQIPKSVADTAGGKYFEPYPGAIMHFKGRIFFGVNSQDMSNMGVYSLLETQSGNILNMEHFVSTEVTGGQYPLRVGALLGISRDQFVAGFRDNDTYGIDLLSATSYAYTTDYGGFFESPLYQVGSYFDKRKYNKMEFFLAKELATDEGIRVKFRINLTDSWTTIGTYTTVEIGTGRTSHHIEPLPIPDCEQLQIRVELLGTSTTTPEFKQLVLS